MPYAEYILHPAVDRCIMHGVLRTCMHRMSRASRPDVVLVFQICLGYSSTSQVRSTGLDVLAG